MFWDAGIVGVCLLESRGVACYAHSLKPRENRERCFTKAKGPQLECCHHVTRVAADCPYSLVGTILNMSMPVVVLLHL